MENILSRRVAQMWKETESSGTETAFPAFLPVTEAEEKKRNEERISESLERLGEELDSFPGRFGFFGRKRRWKKRMERQIDRLLFDKPLLSIDQVLPGDTLRAFREETAVFLKRARAFAPALSLEDLGQAQRNYMVYAIFRELNGLPQKCTSAIFGYSMLYPFTDNFIDGQEKSREEKAHFNRLIADKLSGRAFEAVSEEEKQTARLLAAVEEDYGREDEIFKGLLLMLEAQKDSQRQQDAGEAVTGEQALAISIRKGGLSVLIDRYFVNRPMTESDLFFYYGFGFLLQLCDDLQDISEDRKNGSRTVFSMCGSKEETAGNINRLLHFTRRLFAHCACERESFRRFLFDNCCLLILFSAMGSGEHVPEEWLSEAQRHLPVSPEYVEALKNNIPAPGNICLNDKKYGKMLDALL